jgi:hypothetical protein
LIAVYSFSISIGIKAWRMAKHPLPGWNLRMSPGQKHLHAILSGASGNCISANRAIRAKASRVRNDLRALDLGLSAHRVDNSKYPYPRDGISVQKTWSI